MMRRLVTEHRPRITLLCVHSPFPAISGGPIRLAGLCHGLAQLGTVQVISLYKPQDGTPPQGITEHCTHTNLIQNVGSGTLLSPLSPRFLPAVAAQILAAVAKSAPDILVVSQPSFYGMIPRLHGLAPTLVLDLHNIESDILAARLARNAWRYLPGNLWRTVLQNWAARRQERTAASLADKVWVCSAVDQARLNALWGIAAQAVANPVPDASLYNLPITAARYAAGRMLFVGLLTYRPNGLAIEYLLQRIMPILPETLSLIVAGRGVEYGKSLGPLPARVQLRLNSPDLRAELAEAGFAPLPIFAGSGTRIKVIEAMAAGIVVVASAKAVEGLGLTDGVEFIAAETPAAYLAALTHLQSCPDKAVQLAQAARAFIAERHGAAAIAAQIKAGLAP